MRASVSIGPPAANGTTMVTGRLGQSSAAAVAGEGRPCQGKDRANGELGKTHGSPASLTELVSAA